jgi:predicted nucleic acid-binding protein
VSVVVDSRPALAIHAKQGGLVGGVKVLLDEMRAAGFFLDEPRYQSLLRQTGE